MKKNLLSAFILVLLGGSVFSQSIQIPSAKKVSAREITNLLSPGQLPADGILVAKMVMSYVDQTMNAGYLKMAPLASMTEVLHKDWNGSAWVNSSKEQIHLDDNGWAIDSYNFEWDNGAWVVNFWSSMTNNSSGQPVHLIIKMWENGAWQDMMQADYTYNQYGPLQILMQFYFGTSWVNMMKSDFYYNAQGQCTEIITKGWDMVNSVWVNDAKDSYTYNASGWMIEELTQFWEEGAWVNMEIGYSTYEAGGHETEKLTKSWAGNAWENYMHFTYTYNGQWLMTEELRESWYSGAWNNNEKINFQYDAQGRMIEELYKTWQTSKGWVNDELATWTYDLTIGITPVNMPGQEAVIFPNPACDNTAVGYELATDSYVSIRLYTMTGKAVATLKDETQQAGEHRIELATSALQSGLYLVKISIGGVETVKRLVVAR